LLFKKKISVEHFTSWLIALHADFFGPRQLKKDAEGAGISLEDLPSPENALLEWAIFGFFTVTTGVRSACGDNTNLCDAIMNSFVTRTYAGLVNGEMKIPEFPDYEESASDLYRRLADGGMKLSDFRDLPKLIHDRCDEYTEAHARCEDAKSLRELNKAVSERVMGEAARMPSGVVFGMLATRAWIECAKGIIEPFRKFKFKS
jgi:hypothetical protein